MNVLLQQRLGYIQDFVRMLFLVLHCQGEEDEKQPSELPSTCLCEQTKLLRMTILCQQHRLELLPEQTSQL